MTINTTPKGVWVGGTVAVATIGRTQSWSPSPTSSI